MYQQVVNHLKGLFEDFVIDTGGRDTKSQRSAIIVSDVYILPFRPRSFDVWTLYDSINLVEESKIINPKLRVVAVLNQADFKSSSENEDSRKFFVEDPITKKSLVLLDAPSQYPKGFCSVRRRRLIRRGAKTTRPEGYRRNAAFFRFCY